MFFAKKRKKQFEVHGFIRRLVDHSTSGVQCQDEEVRKEKRINRTLPVLIVPFDGEEPDVSSAVFAVTKDLSSEGVAILSQQPVESDELIVGFWSDSRCEFVRGNVCYRRPADGGYWQLGVALTEVVPRSDNLALLELSRMADRLTVTSDDGMGSVRVTAG